MSEVCQHCRAAIEGCDCGANNDMRHWVPAGMSNNPMGSRYCRRPDGSLSDQLHAPEVRDEP